MCPSVAATKYFTHFQGQYTYVQQFGDKIMFKTKHHSYIKRKCKLLNYCGCIPKTLPHFKYCLPDHCQVSKSNWLRHHLRATIDSWYKEIDICLYNNVTSLFLTSSVIFVSILSTTFLRILSSLSKRKDNSHSQLVIKITELIRVHYRFK